MTLCSDFIKQSRATWKLLRKSVHVGLSIGEETITDLNLLALQSKHSREIITVKCNKPLEGLLGIDWEWFILSFGSALAVRFQAKKLNTASLDYPELGHKQKSGQRQIDLLIDSSLRVAHSPIPLYVFYNYWERGRFNPKWLCGAYRRANTMLGCGVAYAPGVRQLLNKGSDRLADITHIMYPWSCLVCCTLGRSSNDNLVNRAFAFIQKLLATMEFSDELSKERSVRDGVPSYVTKILEQTALSDEDWLEAGVKRITLIREG